MKNIKTKITVLLVLLCATVSVFSKGAEEVIPTPRNLYVLKEYVFEDPRGNGCSEEASHDLVAASKSLIMCPTSNQGGPCIYEPTFVDDYDNNFRAVLDKQIEQLCKFRRRVKELLGRWDGLGYYDSNFGANGIFISQYRPKVRSVTTQLETVLTKLRQYPGQGSWHDVSGRLRFRVSGPMLFVNAYIGLINCIAGQIDVAVDRRNFESDDSVGYVDLDVGNNRNIVLACEKAAYRAIKAPTYFGDNILSPIIQPLVRPISGVRDLISDISTNANACGGPDVYAYYNETNAAKRAKLPPPLGECSGATNTSGIICLKSGMCSDRSNTGYLIDWTDVIDSRLRRPRQVGEVWTDWSNCREQFGTRRRISQSIKDLRTEKLPCEESPY